MPAKDRYAYSLGLASGWEGRVHAAQSDDDSKVYHLTAYITASNQQAESSHYKCTQQAEFVHVLAVYLFTASTASRQHALLATFDWYSHPPTLMSSTALHVLQAHARGRHAIAHAVHVPWPSMHATSRSVRVRFQPLFKHTIQAGAEDVPTSAAAGAQARTLERPDGRVPYPPRAD